MYNNLLEKMFYELGKLPSLLNPSLYNVFESVVEGLDSYYVKSFSKQASMKEFPEVERQSCYEIHLNEELNERIFYFVYEDKKLIHFKYNPILVAERIYEFKEFKRLLINNSLVNYGLWDLLDSDSRIVLTIELDEHNEFIEEIHFIPDNADYKGWFLEFVENYASRFYLSLQQLEEYDESMLIDIGSLVRVVEKRFKVEEPGQIHNVVFPEDSEKNEIECLGFGDDPWKV